MITKTFLPQLKEIAKFLDWEIIETENGIQGFKASSVFMCYISINRYSKVPSLPTHYNISVQPNGQIYHFFQTNHMVSMSDYFNRYRQEINAKIDQKPEIIARKIKKIFDALAKKETVLIEMIEQKKLTISENKMAVKKVADFLGKRNSDKEGEHFYLKDCNIITVSYGKAKLEIQLPIDKAIEVIEYLKLREKE